MSVMEQPGDLFEGSEAALAHGCNCAGAMARGIAVEFRRRWPPMYLRYRDLCKRGELNPGDIFVWTADDRVIFNLATQRTWRTPATLVAVAAATGRMVEYAQAHGIDAIGMPRIGAGLGRLNWSDVRAVLDPLVPDDLDVIVYSSPAHRSRTSTAG